MNLSDICRALKPFEQTYREVLEAGAEKHKKRLG